MHTSKKLFSNTVILNHKIMNDPNQVRLEGNRSKSNYLRTSLCVEMYTKMRSGLLKKMILFTMIYIATFVHSNCQTNLRSVSFTTDQDVIVAGNQDRNYTMGVQFSVTSSIAFERNNYYVLPWMRKRIDYLFGLKDINQDSLFIQPFSSTISILGSGFTPLDLTKINIDPEDRPYGSLVVIGSTRTTAMNEEASVESGELEPPKKYAVSTGLYIGMLGLPVAKNVQSYIHENHWFGSTRPVPEGWQNQISNGGEPTLLYHYQMITPLVTLEEDCMKRFETTIDGGVQLGYYTNLSFGLNTRLGKFDSPYWALCNILDNANQAPDCSTRKKIKWNIILSARLRYVAYNALLQGQFKKSAYTLSRDNVSPFVVEAFCGIEATFYNRVTINFRPINIRTSEFAYANRNHAWGSFGISYNLTK
jgi:hypothetical protein